MKDIEVLTNELESFAAKRNWEQFHSPKNLAMALSGEAGELLEIFQWLTEEQSKSLSDKQLQRVEEELADVFLYLLRIADKTGVNIIEAASKKIEINEKKYPADKAYGNATKYSDL
ncbi:nucleotide pyrophosphohydrolase [Vibrio splendidus]|uniref:nucleotide pyrophosphohydrolase n=1 Tax=Vibrio splendidus TaxID=29497 RepID=UPI000D35398B|nr:nucleotide pyrophosphohydrolase [Vibrio splendidus]PTO77546.1 nucleotide pyrophosphohydrolase [Vibrio splendidus]